ncbi:MAG: limonene-1,2-epoxide hydrolase [Actinomycetia bacterium]|nr:limonene-1,2-epoxide hydrolase [Actinomycetes bacterium]
MPIGLQPTAADRSTLPNEPQAVVEAFLAALADHDVDTARALVDDDILYVNVGLPAVRGREQMDKVFALLDRPSSDFEVYMHSISADGKTVLTERTDVLVAGPLRAQFWVWGRFDVVDGKIVLWRDSFDFLDIVRGTLRGALAMVVPGLAPLPPRGDNDPPGR